MTIVITPLLEVARRHVSQPPPQWPNPLTAHDYHHAIVTSVNAVALMMSTYQALQSVMSDKYREMSRLRTGFDYLSAIPDVRGLLREQGILALGETPLYRDTTFTEDLLRNNQLIAVTGRGTRYPVEISSELISMGNDVLSALFQRLTAHDQSVPAFGLEWQSRYDGVSSLDQAIASIERVATAITDAHQRDIPMDVATMECLTQSMSWTYTQNCPPYSERCAIAHNRIARSWADIDATELTGELHPHLDIYLAKLIMTHGRLQFKLMMLSRYAELTSDLVNYLYGIFEAAQRHYDSGHLYHSQYLEVHHYIFGENHG